MLMRNLSTTIVTQFSGLFLGIITSVVINRALLPEGKGNLATFMVGVEMITLFSTFGLQKALVYEVGQNKGHRDVVANAFTISLANGILVGLLALVAVFATGSTLFGDLTTTAMLLAVPSAMFIALMGFLEGIVRGLNRIWHCNVAAILNRLVYLGVPLFGVITQTITLEGVIFGYMLSNLITAAYYYFVIRGDFDGLKILRDGFKRLFSYGLKYLLYSLVSNLHNRIDVLIIGILLTQTQVGFYSTAVGLAQMLWNLPTAISFVVMPHIANKVKGDDSSLQTARIARVSLIILFVMALALALVAPLVISLLYGDDFLPSVPALQYLLPGIVTFSTVRILGGHLVGRGRIVALTVVSTIILVVNVIMNLILIPAWGVVGASISSSVTYTINAILFAWLLSQEGYLRPIDVLLPKREDFAVLIQGLVRAVKRTSSIAKSSAKVTS